MRVEKCFFTGKFEYFFDGKWLFCEGFMKIVIFELRSVIFETLQRGLFCGVFLRLFWKVVRRSFECDLRLP